MLSSSWYIYRKTFATPREQLGTRTVAFLDLQENVVPVEEGIGTQTNNEMSPHRSRRPTSSDSGYSTTSEGRSPLLEDKRTVRSIQNDLDTAPTSTEDRNASLLSIARRDDLTSSIGTQLSGIQLSNLSASQLDELALLVSERGVVILREQDLTSEEQLGISQHYGSTHGQHVVERTLESLKLKTSAADHGERFTLANGRQNVWRSERSFEVNPPSYSVLKANESGGETIWVSQYGLYDSLSRHMRGFLGELHAVHTSSLQYGEIINLRGMPFDRSPIENSHLAVRTNPVTGLKALNITPGSVTGFADLSQKESDKILELLKDHLQSSDEHTVRFRWEAGSVAIWDNRCTAYKHVTSSKEGLLKFTETSSIGEKPYLDPRSESRSEKLERLVKEEQERVLRQEAIRKRFNNTPLRRILRSQAIGEQYASTPSSPVAAENTPSDPATPHISRTDDTPRSSVSKTGQTQREGSITFQPEISGPPKRSSRTHVSSKGSPLRRIIQRQASIEIKVR